MKYKIFDNKIIIEDISQFNIRQIFDCGQIFRYYIHNDMVAEVVSTDKYAQITTLKECVEVQTSDIDYFVKFFDLDRDYNAIKHQLSDDKFLSPCINFGYGIRILNQDLFEMIVSFIISANNNIKRIKNSLNHLSKKFGTKMSTPITIVSENSPLCVNNANRVEYYAFPTLSQLKNATIDDYIEAGLGYRAEYMYHTIQRLDDNILAKFGDLSEEEQLEFLLSLKGVGEKVAHCILLFAMHRTNVFPVDTWINKVYNDLTHTSTTNRRAISKELSNRYNNLSGYAQQYFFYYYRSK
ncbi:MAG: hypothetical protein IJ371_00875 [Clostridia bacterium]|nr:hypothetical protein [Clostridia bacterium]